MGQVALYLRDILILLMTSEKPSGGSPHMHKVSASRGMELSVQPPPALFPPESGASASSHSLSFQDSGKSGDMIAPPVVISLLS